MSRTLSMKSGSDDSLNVSTRWGFNPKARQMRLTARLPTGQGNRWRGRGSGRARDLGRVDSH
jgi:hypothetical protein